MTGAFKTLPLPPPPSRRRDARPLLPRALLALLLAALATGGTSGCAKGTYLEVRVTGAGLPDVYGIRMALTLRPASETPKHSTDVVHPDNGGVIKLPTSMAFSLDDDTGGLLLEATALGMNGTPIAAGSVLTTIMRDKTWTVTINLDPI